jgi:hypothetical protein
VQSKTRAEENGSVSLHSEWDAFTKPPGPATIGSWEGPSLAESFGYFEGSNSNTIALIQKVRSALHRSSSDTSLTRPRIGRLGTPGQTWCPIHTQYRDRGRGTSNHRAYSRSTDTELSGTILCRRSQLVRTLPSSLDISLKLFVKIDYNF